MLTDAARTYSTLFAPEMFVPLCGLLVVAYEWRAVPERTLAGFGTRVGVFAVGWVVAFAVYRGVPRLLATTPEWGPDAAGSAGLGLGIGVVWLGWRLRSWGGLVPGFALALLAVTGPHLLVTPVWDISSHVLYAMTPAGYLALVDRRFAPLSLVPAGMVFARPLAGAHTWVQSTGGFVLALACLLALYGVGVPGGRRSPAA
jgi:hypothetical protein